MVLVDHIIPIEDGGAVFDLSNFQSLCSACHKKKHGKGITSPHLSRQKIEIIIFAGRY
ncbi:MAG: HNH endonuclease [Synergistaceae bacterium]|nr:HNH endonuclease [Synergistaceae bacterium]